ncbi:hypothetical protein BGZ46_000407 [Entomortierella lignicola]|nr:hypothetical protein BGZ46_000407 [Entomortierella lignicola]
MFTIFVVPPQDISPPPPTITTSTTTCPHNAKTKNDPCAKEYTFNQEQRPQSRRFRRCSTVGTSCPSPSPRPYTYSLIDKLQTSVFFGGLGSLSREVEAMDRQMAAENLAKASLKARLQQENLLLSSSSLIPSDDSSNAMTVTNTTGQEQDLWSRISKVFHLDTNTEPLKHYKITVEELDQPQGQTSKEPVITTATAVMPPAVMDWLLRATRQDPSNTTAAIEDTLQPIEVLSNASSEDTATKDKSVDTAHLAPASAASQEHDLAAAVAASTAAIVAANSTNANAQSNKVREQPSTASPVVVNRVKVDEHSFTQTTITRPDGTREFKFVTVNRETGATETHTRVEHVDGSIQESIQSPKGSKWTTIRQRKQEQQGQTQQQEVQQQQQVQQQVLQQVQQQTQEQKPVVVNTVEQDTEAESRRQSFRERLYQRRQERAERRREKQERRQELREAEARQREMTAAAYGFGYDENGNAREGHRESFEEEEDPHRARKEFHRFHDSNHRNVWRQRREEREREQEQERERVRMRNGNNDGRNARKNDDSDEQVSYSKSKSWPPRGYLRRMEEQEQEHEPRHNV